MAPFDLRDLRELVVRANRTQAPRETFETKAARWTGLWPHLKVLAWEDGVGAPGERWTSPEAAEAPARRP